MSDSGPRLIVPYRPLVLDRSNMPQAIMSDESESEAAFLAYEGMIRSDHTVLELPAGDFEVMDLDITKHHSVVLPPVRSVIRNTMLGKASFISVRNNDIDTDLNMPIDERNSPMLVYSIDFDVLVVVQRLARDIGYAATLALIPEEISDDATYRFDAY